MLVYGKNVLKEMSKEKIKKVYISRKDYVEYLKCENIKFEFVDNSKLNRMVEGNHQGVVLDIYDYEYKTMDQIEGDFVVILDHLSDPHNFGAIVRSCACAGVKDIIIPSKRSVSVNDVVMKTSAGNIDKVNIIMVPNLVNAINNLKQKGFFIYASDMDGECYKTLDYSGKKALVIGSEGDGVSRLVLDNSDFTVAIDIMPDTESLNASVAAGILMFEMRD